MSVKVLDQLKKVRPDAEIGLFDPVIVADDLGARFPDERVFSRLGDAVTGAGIVIIANNHPALARIPPRTMSEFIAPNGFIFDYWNHFSNLPASELVDSYFAVGNSGLAL